MASSMLFVTNKNPTRVYGLVNPSSIPINTIPLGTYIRVTHIWEFDTISKAIRALEENEIDDDTPNKIKMLFYKGGYVNKADTNYIRNFQGDYASATLINLEVICKNSSDILYGPDIRAEKKGSVIQGTKLKVTREKDGFYFVTTPDGLQGWIDKSNVNGPEVMTPVQSPVSGSGIVIPAETKIAVSGPRVRDGSMFAVDDEITALVNSAGIYNRKQMAWYDRFNRFGVIDPYTGITTTKEYIFFTKPDLHMFENKNSSVLYEKLQNVPIFVDAMRRYKPVLRQLQWSANNNSGPFINLLSNTVRSSLDLPAINAGEVETSANIYGTRLSYRGTSIESDDAHEFTLEFEDTKYLEVYMFFKLYDEYERRKFVGEIKPPDENYIFRKRLHDQIAIYKFVVGEDGESLVYWAKLYGCYPKSVPRESFSDMSNNGLRFTVTWKSQFVEDMDPQILTDFNRLVRPLYSSTFMTDLPLYNKKLEAPDGRWAGIPYIAIPNIKDKPLERNEMEYKYLLKWRL